MNKERKYFVCECKTNKNNSTLYLMIGGDDIIRFSDHEPRPIKKGTQNLYSIILDTDIINKMKKKMVTND